MNASFRGSSLKNPLRKVKAINPEGKLIEFTKEECELRHRGSLLKDKKYLIIEATFELKKGDQIIIQKTMTNKDLKSSLCILEVLDTFLFWIMLSMGVCMRNIRNLILLVIK